MTTSEIAAAAGAPAFAAAGASDSGRVRDGNEDRFHVDAARGIFVIADGVGGHAAGEVAASIAVDVVARRLERPLWSHEQRVREAIALANNEILTQAEASPLYRGMTCVLTLALVSERAVTVGHVGDTRLYRLTPDRMVKLTHDHSPIGEREDAGEITEAEAMRHPRRNQVFRDVGSSFHEPDDADFVEVIEAPFDERTALLLCSDGLSDMLASAAIESIVRQHAGEPARVVEALIQAANEAGGRDNVTVIYVEGTGFAHAPRGAVSDAASPDPSREPTTVSEHRSPAWGVSFGQTPGQRSTAWLVAGLCAGFVAGIGLSWLLTHDAQRGAATGRTLIVRSAGTPESSGTYASIADALAQAVPRDVVQVEPGEFVESVVLPDGVSIAARVPGSVTLVGRPEQSGWISLVANGRLGQRITGLRVLGHPDARIAVGLRLAGHGVEVDDVTLEGDIETGIDILNDGDVTVRGSRITDIAGVPLRLGAGSRPVIRQNQFLHASGARTPALDATPDATVDHITNNLFSGYADLVNGSPARESQLAGANFILTPAPRRRTP